MLLAFAPGATLSTHPTTAQDSTVEARTDWGLAESSRQMLIQRCAQCHSPESQDRKARRALADVADLATTAEEFVTAGDPDASELYYLILDGDMPPEDSDVAPPTEQELALLHAWISGGATMPTGAPAPVLQDSEPESVSASHYVARSHPLWIHFPLALIPVALLASLLARVTRKSALDTTALFCVALAIPSAALAATSGWLHAAEMGPTEGMDLHRWLGVGTAVASLLAFLVRKRRALFLLLLAVASGVGAAAGHFGGRITYGPDFFPW
ncbi:MAG: hypothetical protein P1V35_17315 [Planctomycetota bacterium]|nr:hypothetical protein [Planctomycetota bacterium]